jgi:hypothetical protein
MIIKKLKPEDFGRLKRIFADEFESSLPLPENSEIFVCYEDGVMRGFLLAENIKILGQMYVVPEKRNNSGKIVQSLLNFVRERFDGKEVVGAVASESRFENLYQAFGMQKIEGKFYRKNLD